MIDLNLTMPTSRNRRGMEGHAVSGSEASVPAHVLSLFLGTCFFNPKIDVKVLGVYRPFAKLQKLSCRITLTTIKSVYYQIRLSNPYTIKSDDLKLSNPTPAHAACTCLPALIINFN